MIHTARRLPVNWSGPSQVHDDRPGEQRRPVRCARGKFGGLIPIRPATKNPVVCLRGHRLDLDLYDKLKSYSHRYRLHGTLCEVCRAQEGCERAARRLAEWAHLDVTFQYPPGSAPGDGLVLVAVRRPRERWPAGSNFISTAPRSAR